MSGFGGTAQCGDSYASIGEQAQHPFEELRALVPPVPEQLGVVRDNDEPGSTVSLPCEILEASSYDGNEVRGIVREERLRGQRIPGQLVDRIDVHAGDS
jgi:hypothetical protein